MARPGQQTGLLPVVYAMEDGGVLLRGTRWEPRKVLCSRKRVLSGGAIEYVVKFRRGEPVGAAALISEVVCHSLLTELQLETLDAALVRVSRAVARLYQERQLTEYEVLEGTHFGTVYRPDLDPADPRTWMPTFVDAMADPQELVALWAADSWLMNLDRTISGNILLEVDAEGKTHLIAADQSDCFLGAGALADGSCFTRSPGHGAAPYLPFMERVLLQGGVARLRQVAQQIQGMEEALERAVALAPNDWWRQATISPEAVVNCLLERAGRIERIVALSKWEEMGRAIEAGYRLDL